MSLLEYLIQNLSESLDHRERRDMALWIAEELTSLSRTELLLGKDTTNISNSQSTELFSRADAILTRLQKGEPLPYILGYIDWYGLRISLSPNTLIPRPETAELVSWLIEDNENLNRGDADLRQYEEGDVECSTTKVLDLCTGSGCIALVIKKAHPEWNVIGVDISEEAIKIARANARQNNLSVDFSQADVLRPHDWKSRARLKVQTPHIIISNPPYILEKEKPLMDSSVIDYEPEDALFVPDSDPLLFYREIIRQYPSATIYFEINPLMTAELEDLAKYYHRAYSFRTDFAGKTRFMKVWTENITLCGDRFLTICFAVASVSTAGQCVGLL